jgi:hypothetical protein
MCFTIPKRQGTMIIELTVQLGGGSVVVVSGGAFTIKGPKPTWAHICLGVGGLTKAAN